MRISVVIRTKDEADRLRLVLASLTRQTVPFVEPGSPVPSGETDAGDRPGGGGPEFNPGSPVPSGETDAELIVVDDGSADHTPAVIAEAAGWLPFRALRHPTARGRSAASNAGAREAVGEVLLFLDGDMLACPETVALHARRLAGASAIGRGELFHLRCTRFFLDPETGTPRPGEEDRVARLGPELDRHRVTRRQVLDHFDEIDRRAEHGIYPGAGPRRLADLEMDALRNHPGLSVSWMAASGSNQSIRREDFEATGGFDERLTINAHREIALRLAARGIPVVPVDGAKTYHLTHRVGWRDPLAETDWERTFYDTHPCLAVKLMSVFWLGISDRQAIPEEARITSLPHFDAIVRDGTTIDYDAIRRAHPALPELG